MSGRKSIKVIFDTNIWISFLIGKGLQVIREMIVGQQIVILLSEQLLLELQTVTQRPKLKKYFPEQKVDELLTFLRTVGEISQPEVKNQLSRDPKDNFLLDLAETARADFLVTGDKDLLILNPFRKTKIMTPADFEMQVVKASR
jgi:putative PIN family toxin of toxin-antitoxin system